MKVYQAPHVRQSRRFMVQSKLAAYVQDYNQKGIAPNRTQLEAKLVSLHMEKDATRTERAQTMSLCNKSTRAKWKQRWKLRFCTSKQFHERMTLDKIRPKVCIPLT